MSPPKENPRAMHDRVLILEKNHQNVLSRLDSVESSVAHLSDKIDRVLDFVQEAKVRQLPPIQTILVTTVATCTLVSMVVMGIYWMVDSRVGFAVQRTNNFVSMLADGNNNIFVQLHDYDMRLKRLENSPPKN
jgi:hypothetical protein